MSDRVKAAVREAAEGVVNEFDPLLGTAGDPDDDSTSVVEEIIASTLERHGIHEASREGSAVAERGPRDGVMADAAVLAASPAFAGSMTRPYRIVLLKHADGSFSVHRKYLDDLGGFDEGSYLRTDYAAAMDVWMKRSAREIEIRGPACHVHFPV